MKISWLLMIALLGMGILYLHFNYLDDLSELDWGPKYLQPNQENPEFIWLLNDIKPLLLAVWLATCFIFIDKSLRGLRRKHIAVNSQVLRRMIVALVLFCISVTPYNPPDIDLTTYFFVNSVGYGLVIYALLKLPDIELVFAWIGERFLKVFKSPELHWKQAIALSMFLASAFLGWDYYHFIPQLFDSTLQSLHAQIIASGHWYENSHPLREFFNTQHMVNNGKWYSHYPPGHILMLTIGYLLGCPGLVNPTIGAITGIFIYLLAKELYGIQVAKMATLLSMCCFYIVIMSSERMNHATSLLSATIFLWGYFRVLHRARWQDALIAGAGLGYLIITRPYTALGFSLPAAIYGLYLILRYTRTYLVPMIVMGLTVSVFLMFLGYYNYVTNGSPFMFGYEASHGAWHIPFTEEANKRYTAQYVVVSALRTWQHISWFSRILFDWPVPSLLLVALVFGVRGHKRDEKLLLAIIISMFISCAILPNLGEELFAWGPRFLYELCGILVVLSAKGLTLIPPLLRSISIHRYPRRVYYGGGVAIMACFYVFSLQYSLTTRIIWDEYTLYISNNRLSFYNYIKKYTETPALVFVPPDFFHFIANNNPRHDDTPIIFANDLGEKNKELMAYYPNRNVYWATMDDNWQTVLEKPKKESPNERVLILPPLPDESKKDPAKNDPKVPKVKPEKKITAKHGKKMIPGN